MYSDDQSDMKKVITHWFMVGTISHMTHLVVVKLSFDDKYHPLYVDRNRDAKTLISHYELHYGAKIFEVYNLSLPLRDQLNDPERCWNF